MVFQSNTWSVLLVSASDALVHSVMPLLSPAEYYPVTRAASLQEAKRYTADLVLLNAPLPDGDALDYAVHLCSETDSAVLLLVPQDQLESVSVQARQAGILTLGKPVSSARFQQSLEALGVLRERLRVRQEQLHTVEETIEELKLVNRAKWLLITTLNMTEDEAHRYIVRLAMQQQRPKREIAGRIIRTYSQ